MTPQFLRRPVALLAAAVTALAAALVAIEVAPHASASDSTPTTTQRVVAHNGSGKLRSRIVGHTSDGRQVTGAFVPLKFVNRGGHLKVRGVVEGVIHNANGTTQTFAGLHTLKVKRINGRSMRSLTPARAAVAARTCGILDLVLGPLDLDLLGLQVHLDRVVLNIVAVTGAGNLLGNLLCSVAGLLDGGLSGLLGQIRTLLNQILGVLNLGV